MTMICYLLSLAPGPPLSAVIATFAAAHPVIYAVIWAGILIAWFSFVAVMTKSDGISTDE